MCWLMLWGSKTLLTADSLMPMSPEPTCVMWTKFVGSPIMERSILRLRFCKRHTTWNKSAWSVKMVWKTQKLKLDPNISRLNTKVNTNDCELSFHHHLHHYRIRTQALVTHRLWLFSNAAAETHPELGHVPSALTSSSDSLFSLPVCRLVFLLTSHSRLTETDFNNWQHAGDASSTAPADADSGHWILLNHGHTITE